MISERQLRLAICSIGSEMYGRRYIVASDGNISVRLAEDNMLITPSGACKGKMRPDDLVVVSLGGEKKRGAGSLSSEWQMHSAIYKTRPDFNAIVHGHPLFATTFAACGLALDEYVLPEIITTLGHIPLAGYATPGSAAVGENVKTHIRRFNAVLLENHGVVTAGRTLDEAFQHFERVEHAAQIVYQSRVLGKLQTLGKREIDELLGGD